MDRGQLHMAIHHGASVAGDMLDDTERLVLTAKYIKAIRWDFIEFHVFYSRRQAIRIHNEAIKKLVGQEVKI